MIKQSLLALLLLSGSAFAGKKTANTLYYFTKLGCYGTAAGVTVATAPMTVAVVGTGAVLAPAGATIVGSAVVKSGALGILASTETLAQKAYNLGMKL